MKEIPLTQGAVAIVDDADFETACKFNWFLAVRRNRKYAGRNARLPCGKKTTQFLHQVILGAKGIDHKDGDGLNNRRENLRAASKSENGRAALTKKPGATSVYRGVCWSTARKRWVCQITYANRKNRFLGHFFDEVEAAKAYDEAAKECFGEFASLNFPTPRD